MQNLLYRNHCHKLSLVALGIRLAYVIPAFVLCLFSHSYLWCSLVGVQYLILWRWVCNISFRTMSTYLLIPLVFILSSALVLLFDVFGDQSAPWGICTEEVPHVLLLISRSLSMMIIVNFSMGIFSLSEMIKIGAKARVPGMMLELMVLMYRFIHRCIEGTYKLYIAQKCRLAYCSRKSSYQDLGALFYRVFTNAWKDTYAIQIALDSRMVEDRLLFVGKSIPYCSKHIFIPIAINICIVIEWIWIY